MKSVGFNGHCEHDHISHIDFGYFGSHLSNRMPHENSALNFPWFPRSKGLWGHSGPLGCGRKVMGAAYVQDALALHPLEEPRRLESLRFHGYPSSSWRCQLYHIDSHCIMMIRTIWLNYNGLTLTEKWNHAYIMGNSPNTALFHLVSG